MVLYEAVKRIRRQFCKPGLAKPFEAPDSSEWRQVRDPVGGFGGSPVAHRTIKGSIKSIESVDICRQLARLTPAAAPEFFFVLGTGLVVPGRPRERNSSVKLSGGPAV